MIYTVERRCPGGNGETITYRDAFEGVEASLPLSRFGELYRPPEIGAARPRCVRDAFDSPVGSPPLRTVARGKRTAAILVSDATRAVPTGDVVPYLMEELNAGGIAPDDVTFVVATGVHRPATEEEMRRILGEEWRGRVRIENHDPYRDDALVFLGTTTFGTPVSVNRKVAAADLRIAVGKVEPHEFAGFSGGRKSVLPGISSETTIRANHRPEMILDPKATIGVYGDNPVSLDMVEAARLLGVHFCVNVLVTGDGRIADVVCGDIVESHGRAVAALVERIAVPVRSRLPVVVTTPGHPLNINLYQSIKCVIATAPIVEDRGVIVAYSRCPEGVGSTDMLRPYENARTPEDVVDFLLRNYEIQMDHTLLLSKILKRGIRVVLVSPGVERTTVELMGLIFAESLGEGIGIASGLTGDGCPISFFPCPQRCLPFARGGKA